MKVMLITNNNKVFENYEDQAEIIFLAEGTYMDVLYKARDYVHKGYQLLSHPLSGSLKPNQTPYKSIVLENHTSDMEQCHESIMFMENSIESAEKFLSYKRTPNWTDKVKEDFKTIDLSFLQGSINKLL
ncbi:MAG: GrdX family protein [Anaerovorax sp.]